MLNKAYICQPNCTADDQYQVGNFPVLNSHCLLILRTGRKIISIWNKKENVFKYFFYDDVSFQISRGIIIISVSSI